VFGWSKGGICWGLWSDLKLFGLGMRLGFVCLSVVQTGSMLVAVESV
jgi:hypothetical protein